MNEARNPTISTLNSGNDNEHRVSVRQPGPDKTIAVHATKRAGLHGEGTRVRIAQPPPRDLTRFVA
jgi:hypothetical protein